MLVLIGASLWALGSVGVENLEFDFNFQYKVEKANELAKGWLESNLRNKGLFMYAFNPETNEVSTHNNAIRQLMASRVLAVESAIHEEFLPPHQRNLDFLFKFWYRTNGNEGYVFYDNKSKLGANAIFLRTLVASPLFANYSKEADQLYRGILSLQKESGAFRPWYIEPDYGYDSDYLLTFYSGEAILALVEYYEKTGDPAVLAAAKHSIDFYLNRYVTEQEQNYYPAYVPWYTVALTKLYAIDPEPRYAEAVFIMNDKLLELLDTTNHMGRFYNPATPEYGTPHTSSDAVYTEGLAYAYELAKRVGDVQHRVLYAKALRLAVSNLVSLQYRTVSFPQVELTRYVGALRIREDSTWIRVDTTQHAVDAFTHILQVLK